MNFFGHAVVAGWAEAPPPTILGSMLPDFESMTRVQLLEVRDPAIQKGVALHHATDDAFHSAPEFVSLCSRALRQLTSLDVRRGTARAVAHIGTELFLDGWLARTDGHCGPYLLALSPEANQGLAWADRGARFARLRQRLTHWGPPHDYRDPDFVLGRLTDALRGRPRLSVLDDQRQTLQRFLPDLQQNVVAAAPKLLAHVRDGLGLAP